MKQKKKRKKIEYKKQLCKNSNEEIKRLERRETSTKKSEVEEKNTQIVIRKSSPYQVFCKKNLFLNWNNKLK